MNITIKLIDVVPHEDPYSTGDSTSTVINLDCRDGDLWVSQDMRTNSTTFERYYRHIQEWTVQGNASEESIAELLNYLMGDFQKVVDGYSSKWNGSNHIAQFTNSAQRAIDGIWFYLDNYIYEDYQVWDAYEWIYEEISAIDDLHTWSEKQIAEKVTEYRELAKVEDVIILGDLEYEIKGFVEKAKEKHESLASCT